MSQKNFAVGDIDNNFNILKESYKKAIKENCDFFLTTELSLSGYPPQDLLLRKDFQKKIDFYKKKILSLTKKVSTIFILNIPSFEKKLFNRLYLMQSGKIIFSVTKKSLPNYGVFDEKRYFSSANDTNYFTYKNKKLGFFICEDIWDLKNIDLNISTDLIFVLNASPFEKEKFRQRLSITREVVKSFKSSLIYSNAVGSQDELIFDGGSFLMDKKGKIKEIAPFFEESELILEPSNQKKEIIHISLNNQELIYKALVSSLQDYCKKNRFSSVIIGLSGGIDSALAATIARDALGRERVKLFFLPSKFSSTKSKNDATSLAKNLEIKIDEISIESSRKHLLKQLNFFFKNHPSDVTEENIQSRIRGLLLMALSNKFDSLLLTTGNKSELLVGYSTLYGDMCGGYSILKDVYKTEVYKLCKWRNECDIYPFSNNSQTELIPLSIIEKEPTAELKFNQKDTDSLPPYDVLDDILILLIDKNKDLETIVKKGYNKNIVRSIWNMVKFSEFKRYQSAIGPKISSMSLDKDRRFPIVNLFSI